MSVPRPETPPGTALCLASGILALLTWFVPPFSLALGAFALFNGWRARRAARRQPERYHPSAIPLAATVLVLLAWAGTALVVVGLHAGGGPREAAHEDRW